MTPDARVQSAIELLTEIEESARPADGVASKFFRERRFIGSKDRRDISARVYGVLRHKARLTWLIEHTDVTKRGAFKASARLLVMADMVMVGKHAPSELPTLFSGNRYAPNRLDDPEKALAKSLRDDRLDATRIPAWARGECPPGLYKMFKAAYGEDTDALLQSLLSEAPVDLRANTLKASREDAIKMLALEDLEAEPIADTANGMRLGARVNLGALESFKDGLYEVQDAGSQKIVELIDVQKGESVCDFCAGAGGKTLALSAAMGNKGRLIACDVSQGRLDRAAKRFKRAGAQNIQRRALSSENDKWVKRNKGTFDVVLVDAPCSGTGTWRRNPDARWNMGEDAIKELTQRQKTILESAARLVKPGGRLVYATCSLLPAENQDQVAAFLDAHDDFEQGDVMHLTPLKDDSDGFFATVLTRKS